MRVKCYHEYLGGVVRELQSLTWETNKQTNSPAVQTVELYKFSLLGGFEGDDVTHVEGEVNPVRDMEVISEELRKKVKLRYKNN